jgi:glycosyltransferase involved in cell wall biosynthesis
MHSRFAPPKDHATLLEAFAMFRHTRPGVRCELVLAGTGATLEEEKRRAKEMGLGEDLCSFPGAIPEEDLPAFFGTLDVWCHSSGGETMSTAIMQAMAGGLPIVASDVPGIRGMIESGVHGLLLPPVPSQWADTLVRLADDPQLRRQLGDRAREHAGRWSNAEMLRKYDEVIAEVTARP